MRFDTLYFLAFFVIVLGLSRIKGLGPIVCIVASVLFYMAAGWRDLGLMAFMILLNYSVSLHIQQKKWILYPAILVNLASLLFFKYSSFIAGSFASQQIFTSDIIIPLGISFYTFQMIAYQVDLWRSHIEPIRSLPRFILFITFFPQLVAGPIVRASELSGQIDRYFSGHRRRIIIATGLGLCLLGLVKKVILSDSIAPLVDDIFHEMPADGGTAWVGAWLFGFQIYYDFSGYSDIALGLAYLLGFRLPLNFRQPYLAKSPREFWQRWHITLSTWIRDYLYIPLGGSRRGGKLMQLLVLLFVMAVMGLWHGANWTFAWWGVGWGLAIALWRICPFLDKTPLLSWFLTMLTAFILWVFFRSPDSAYAFDYIGIMFSDFTFPGLLIFSGCLSLLALHFLEARFYNIRGIRLMKRLNNPVAWGIMAGLCLWILILPKGLDNPFIYFRF